MTDVTNTTKAAPTGAMGDDEIVVLASRHGFRNRCDNRSGAARVAEEAIRLTRASDHAAMQTAVEALEDMLALFSADGELRKGTHLNATLQLARTALDALKGVK